jgi:CRP-like cAMP-binding protein
MGKSLLKSLIPINSLTPSNFHELTANTLIETLSAGTRLFTQGDRDWQTIYLLTGEVTLSSTDDVNVRTVVGGTDAARYALAQLNPRQFTGVAKTAVTIARIDSRLLDRLLTWDQAAGYEVAEIEGNQDADWMMSLLRSEAFRKLPPSNISALFARFQTVEVKAGQIIIRQGDAPGDYYYLIKSGKADVLHRSDKTHKVSIIAQIPEGEGFGEEALLSGAPRNATVVMATDGLLMRLTRGDFNDLLREPLVKWVTLNEAKTMVHVGARLLDVRVEDEFQNGTIKGSLNIPLSQLRSQYNALERNRHYIVFCQTGSRSCAAAFLLSRQGFMVSVLRGGLDGLAKQN